MSLACDPIGIAGFPGIIASGWLVALKIRDGRLLLYLFTG